MKRSGTKILAISVLLAISFVSHADPLEKGSPEMVQLVAMGYEISPVEKDDSMTFAAKRTAALTPGVTFSSLETQNS